MKKVLFTLAIVMSLTLTLVVGATTLEEHRTQLVSKYTMVEKRIKELTTELIMIKGEVRFLDKQVAEEATTSKKLKKKGKKKK